MLSIIMIIISRIITNIMISARIIIMNVTLLTMAMIMVMS